MFKITEIIEVSSFFIICKLTNGEVRSLEISQVLQADKNDVFSKNILNRGELVKARVGEFGQLYWENAHYMKDLNDNIIGCEFDISPEFFYNHSNGIG